MRAPVAHREDTSSNGRRTFRLRRPITGRAHLPAQPRKMSQTIPKSRHKRIPRHPEDGHAAERRHNKRAWKSSLQGTEVANGGEVLSALKMMWVRLSDQSHTREAPIQHSLHKRVASPGDRLEPKTIPGRCALSSQSGQQLGRSQSGHNGQPQRGSLKSPESKTLNGPAMWMLLPRASIAAYSVHLNGASTQYTSILRQMRADVALKRRTVTFRPVEEPLPEKRAFW